MKKMKGIITVCLMVLISKGAPSYALDANVVENDGKIDIQYSTQSNQYIMSALSEIRDIGDGDIYITASTRAISGVDYLKIDITLEKWNGSSWSKVTSWSSPVCYNDDHIQFNKTYKGIIGQKYRVKATHTMQENGVPEIESTITASITLK